MSLLERAKSWLAKTFSPELSAWIKGTDTPDSDAGAKLVTPYSQATWVYVAIATIARNVSQIPFRISKLDARRARQVRDLRGSARPSDVRFVRKALGDNIIEGGPVVELFDRPHPTMGRTLFWELLVTWECLRGEFFVIPMDKDDQTVKIREGSIATMLTLPPDMFYHLVQGYDLTAWRYTGSPLVSPVPSEILLPSEVIHERSVNPYLYWRGMSPLSLAMLPAMSDYAAAMFMKGLLLNNADTGIIATTDQPLTQEQREQFATALRERKRKAGTPDRPIFLSNGVKIDKPAISNVDMQFLETRGLLRKEILAIYGMSESMIGFSDAKTSALSGGGNALNEEKLTFLEQNLMPRCSRYAAALDPIITSFDPGLVGWFDFECLPIMQEARRARVDAAGKIFSLGVPFNDINERYDLGFPDYPWGKTGFLPFNLQPATEMSAPEPEETPETQPKNETGPKGFQAANKFLSKLIASTPPVERAPDTAALWRKHMRARQATVRLFTRKVAKVLNDFRGKTLAKLSHVHLEDKAKRVGQTKSLVDLIFNPGEFGNALVMALEPAQRETLDSAGKDAREEVGKTDPWKMPPKKATDFINGRKQPIMGVGDKVREQLNTALEGTYEAGATTDEIADAVKGVYTNLSKGEATRVARTETNIAFNYARQDALDDAGIEYKAWLSSHGPTVRDGHAEAEADYIDDPIPLNEPFIVTSPAGEDEQMMFPGDDSMGASAGNIINCQCVQLAAEKKEEDEKGAWFFVHGLGLLYFQKNKTRSVPLCLCGETKD